MSSAGPRRQSVVSAGAVLTVLLVAGCSSGAGPGPVAPSSAATVPAAESGRSVVVLGHSGATGYDTDPANRGRDVKENSWATGTNPAVDSVYRRLAARSPEYEGHTANLAENGATVANLLQQARDVAGVRPAPGVVLVEILDNDIRCDGTDAQNYAPFTVADLTPDHSHLSISGHKKYADLVWETFFT